MNPNESGSILLVDDSDLVRELLQAALQDAGFSVLVASNGYDAIDLAADPSVIALLLDVSMPGISGPETYGAVAMSRPDLAAVFSSGHPPSVASQEYLERPQVEFLQKPYRLDELFESLRRTIAASISQSAPDSITTT